MTKPIAWSYSSLKDFEGCARRYHATKVLKLYPYKEDAKQRYGNALHKAAELYIRDGKPLEERFEYIQPLLDELMSKPGRKLAEQKMALSVDLEPRSWFDKDVWVRGVADMLILDDENFTAWVADWKTGSDKYPDMDQVKLMAAMAFAHHPHIRKVHGALFFVTKDSMFRGRLLQSEYERTWNGFRQRVARIEAAAAADNWNANPTPLCGWCPHTACEHNPGKRGA